MLDAYWPDNLDTAESLEAMLLLQRKTQLAPAQPPDRADRSTQ